MNYHNITKDDMNNGDGIRVVLWVSGCTHHCEECQNPQTWNEESGVKFDKSALKEIKEELKKDYVTGVTFSGGDPLAHFNIDTVRNLIKEIRHKFPNKTIWVYTGSIFENLMSANILPYIDVLVDGKYEKDLRDTNLKWRGSSNQRVIDVQRSLAENKVVLHCE